MLCTGKSTQSAHEQMSKNSHGPRKILTGSSIGNCYANFKVLSLFISLEIDCFHSQSTVNICGPNRRAMYVTTGTTDIQCVPKTSPPLVITLLSSL